MTPAEIAGLIGTGIKIVVHPRLPLTRIRVDKATGRTIEEDALAWMIDGVIYVHPDRVPLFHAAGINLPLTPPASDGTVPAMSTSPEQE
jgi:hypothetical protein